MPGSWLPDRAPVRCAACGKDLGLASTVLRVRGARWCPDHARCKQVFVLARRLARGNPEVDRAA